VAYQDAIYSHYNWVKARIKIKNPDRKVAGLLNAQDWPEKPFKYDTFFLLDLNDVSVGRQGFSPSNPIKLRQVQWTWINSGTDLKQGERKPNRGDRFNLMLTMQEELLYALYPGYCEKLTWSLNAAGIWIGDSLTPPEFITWTPVEFHKKWDKESSIGYGAGAVSVQDITDQITS